MNKIIINPHYCTREEYQELKDYLTRKCWDWQEISSGKEEKDYSKKEVYYQPEFDYKIWNAKRFGSNMVFKDKKIAQQVFPMLEIKQYENDDIEDRKYVDKFVL